MRQFGATGRKPHFTQFSCHTGTNRRIFNECALNDLALRITRAYAHNKNNRFPQSLAAF
jgi:hypothetical protein